MNKKLYRSNRDKVVSGVCSGIADYFDIDPIIIRVVWVLVTLSTFGTGLIAYIVCAIIIPEKEGFYSSQGNYDTSNSYSSTSNVDTRKNAVVLGSVLIIIGTVLVLKRFFHWVNLGSLWPLLLIGIGLFIIFRREGEK